MIAIAKPFLGEEEKQAVGSVIDSGMIACGAVVEEFERRFAAYTGAAHGIATTSGTTALEVALRALGIGPGDKVLTTPFSFIASTNSIVYTGATPVFADIDPRTFNISVDQIEKKLAEQPDIKALLIVHLFGQACDMDPLLDVVKKHGLLLVEDCAQAHGAMYKGRRVGTFGDAAAFSFYPTKNMTTGEGGMMLTPHQEVAEKARLLINHGMKVRYHHDIMGYNYRMTNMAASIGLCQLDKLDRFNALRNRNAAFYDEHIRHADIVTPFREEERFHCYHQYTLRIKNGRRDAFTQYLADSGIGFGVFYPLSIPEQACYAEMDLDTRYPVTDEIKNEVVSIPVHPQLTTDELETVARVINAFH